MTTVQRRDEDDFEGVPNGDAETVADFCPQCYGRGSVRIGRRLLPCTCALKLSAEFQSNGPAWRLLTNHLRVLVGIAEQPQTRLRALARTLGLAEGTVYGIVVDLADAGYVVKKRIGRRNHYDIQRDLQLPLDGRSRQRTIGEVIDLLGGSCHPSLSPDPELPVR